MKPYYEDDRKIESARLEGYSRGLEEGCDAALQMAEGFPKAFRLVRSEDVSGVSGVGIVAEGVEFNDGSVALRWLSDWPTSVVFHDRGVESVKAIHGHDGRTQIVAMTYQCAYCGKPAPKIEWDGIWRIPICKEHDKVRRR